MEKTKHLVCRLLMLCAVMLFALDVSAQTIISGHVHACHLLHRLYDAGGGGQGRYGGHHER